MQKRRLLVNVRARACNIITHLPGPKYEPHAVRTEIDIFNLFFDGKIIEIIVQSTNIYIEKFEKVFQERERERDARPTHVIEIKALDGLSI